MIITYDDVSKNIDEECDVVVVGSGAGGSVMAKELQESGLRVILVEEGGYHLTPDFQNTDHVSGLVNLYRDAGSTFLMGKPNIMYAEGRCVGGSTTINGGMCWRTPSKILKRWDWEKGLTEVNPTKMEPYFKRVEEVIGVSPVIPEAKNKDSELLKKGAEKLGYRVKSNLRNQRSCVGANQCATGCPTGGKQSPLLTYIPLFIKAGGRLFANTKVQKVKTRGHQACGIVGAIYHPETKKKIAKIKIRSKAVVVSCGAVQTPSLLKRSGIPDASGLLGENLIAHPNTKVIGVFEDEVNAWKGVNQAYQITEFQDEGMIMAVNFVPPGIMGLALPFTGSKFVRTIKEIYHHCVTGAALIEDTSRGRVTNIPFTGQALPLYKLNHRDFELALRATAIMAEVYFAAGAKKVILPLRHLHEIHTVDEIRKIYQYKIEPEDLELMTVHIMGTAQMGDDPQTSVVNQFGEMHQIKGLYVSDASLFPTSIGVNPQETIMALSTRNAFHLAENFAAYK